MDTGNTGVDNISLKFVQAITALENQMSFLVENMKKLDVRWDQATASDNNLRNELSVFKTEHDSQIKQVLKGIDEIKGHLREHCEEIEKKASNERVSALENAVKALFDRQIEFEQARREEAAKRATREEIEAKQRVDEEKKRQIDMDAFTKRNGRQTVAIALLIGIATIIAMFLVVDYQIKKQPQPQPQPQPTINKEIKE